MFFLLRVSLDAGHCLMCGAIHRKHRIRSHNLLRDRGDGQPAPGQGAMVRDAAKKRLRLHPALSALDAVAESGLLSACMHA